MRKFCVFTVVILLLVAAAAAQTKTSGAIKCADSSPNYSIPVPDGTKHALMIAKQACSWTKPFEIAGLKVVNGEDVAMIDDMGNGKMSVVGYHTSNMSNGDKIFVKFQGMDTMKDGKPVSSEGTWNYTGGTGKLKGIKGGGTYKGVGTTTVDGSYELAK